VGFSTPDADILTSLAEKLLIGDRLSAKDERQLKRLLPKYWRQFVDVTLLEPPSVIPKKALGPTRSQAFSKNGKAA
jgi:hypothetical protein